MLFVPAFGKGPPHQQYYHIDDNAYCWGTMHTKVQFLATEMPDEDVCALSVIGNFVLWTLSAVFC